MQKRHVDRHAACEEPAHFAHVNTKKKIIENIRVLKLNAEDIRTIGVRICGSACRLPSHAVRQQRAIFRFRV